MFKLIALEPSSSETKKWVFFLLQAILQRLKRTKHFGAQKGLHDKKIECF